MTDEKEVRQVMAAGLVEAARKDDRIVVLDADLMSCHSTKCFLEAFPERFINVGIAEANLIGVAAGMAAFGKIPFAFSFAPFATRRCYDQIFISVAYSKLPVKIVGSDPGVMAEANGGTHMPFEDMSIMRAIPKMVCFEPTDATMLAKALPQIIDYPGAVYIRMFRKKAEKIYDDSLDFELGKAVTLKEGKDVTLVASGIMVGRAAIGAPWIFREMKYYLRHGCSIPEIPAAEKMALLRRQIAESIGRIDEYRGILHIRRHLAASPLFKGIPDFRAMRIAMLQAKTFGELDGVLKKIEREYLHI